jgi:hypothetical protein
MMATSNPGPFWKGSNIIWSFLGLSAGQMTESRQNIGNCQSNFRRSFRHLLRFGFGTWTENQRVGGSIPRLATIVLRYLRTARAPAASLVQLGRTRVTSH